MKKIPFDEEYRQNMAKLNKSSSSNRPYSWGAYIDRKVKQLLRDIKSFDERLAKMEKAIRNE